MCPESSSAYKKKKYQAIFLCANVTIKSLISCALIAAIAHSSGCLAQTAVSDKSSQQIQRQQERDHQLREQLEKSQDVRMPRGDVKEVTQLPKSESPCFPIRQIKLVSEVDDFDWALAAVDLPEDPATGRCLGSQGINLAMTRIQNAIVARGFVTTRVLASPQDLTGGELTLHVIPGRIRSIRFKEDSGSRANAWNAFPAKSGDLLNLRDIEQALENFKRVPTAEADIQIAPGDKPGESDIVIAWKQSFPFRVNFSFNDGGLRSSGKYQGSTTLSGDHLFALNDLIYYTTNKDLGGGSPGARGTKGNTFHYSLPYGYWTLGYTGGTSRYYQSVAGTNQSYIYSGTSENHEVRLSRLVYRDAANKTTLYARTYLTKSNNYIDDTEVEIQRRRMAGWETGVSHRAFIKDSTLDLGLAWRQGTGAFNAKPAPEETTGDGTARPRILTTDNSLNVPFKLASQNLRYILVLRGQWNDTSLVPQDRFSIGGRYSVRGFDGESVLMAERGLLIRNDLAMTIAEGQEIYAGLDHGEVGGHSADLLIGKRLTGAVLGWRGSYKWASWDIFAGAPIFKPTGFKTAGTTAGFNLNLSF